MRTVSRHIVSLTGATILVAIIWLLWDSRPTTATISNAAHGHATSDLLSSIAWLGLLLTALGLLQRTLQLSNRDAPTLPRQIRHLRSNTAKPRTHSASANGGYSGRAFPLVPKAHSLAVPEPPAAATLHESPPATFRAAASSPTRPAIALEPPAQNGPAISLLGPVTISGTHKHGRRLRGATRELLCYLALHPDGAHRDQITDALWPDQPPEQGRNRLWRAAADARGHLGDSIISRDGERYQLNRTQISIDIDQLHRLLDALEAEQRPEAKLPLFDEALGLFSGEPFAGSDFPWAEDDQRHLQAVHVNLLEETARTRLAAGKPTAALATAKEGLASEPLNEHLTCLAMEAEAALGLRSAVISRYEQLTQTLDEQLGLQPGAETRRLYRQLLSQQAADRSTAQPTRRRSPVS